MWTEKMLKARKDRLRKEFEDVLREKRMTYRKHRRPATNSDRDGWMEDFVLAKLAEIQLAIEHKLPDAFTKPEMGENSD